MTEHLTNISNDIDLILIEDNYEFDIENLNFIKLNILYFKESLENSNDVLKINLAKLKKISNLVYELNVANSFSTLTDHISNELYAFEYILQEELKRKKV